TNSPSKPGGVTSPTRMRRMLAGCGKAHCQLKADLAAQIFGQRPVDRASFERGCVAGGPRLHARSVTSLEASEVVLTFLESVGRRSEAELYLELFRKLPKASFGVIAAEATVTRHAHRSLVEQLSFLTQLGL